MKSSIFIQIASYRDPELLVTIKDCIDKAHKPENLTFGVAWQHAKQDTWDTLDEFKDDKRFRILDIDYKDAKGVCWARNKLQKLYSGEKYTLQLDSHHRFEKGWDSSLIKMLGDLQKKGYKKPLLTSYIPHYNPHSDQRSYIPWKLKFDRFFPQGPAFPTPEYIDEYESLNEPLPARLLSAHFIFTLGKFCKEVPYDPEFYFHGEEPSMAARAYTHGYDLFHPHRVYVWHEYTREGKSKHWEDHDWGEKDRHSYLRYRKLFSMDGEKYNPKEFKEYGFGSVRTLEDYKLYSGIDNTNRQVQKSTIDNIDPSPLTKNEPFLTYAKVVINLHISEIDIHEDYEFWAIAFEDENKQEVARIDASSREVRMLINTRKDGWIDISREFYPERQPRYAVIWPLSKNNGWLSRIVKKLQD